MIRRKAFWNLPNSITVGRIAMVPVMVALLWERPDTHGWWLACAIFVGAMLTDILDGWLARRWDLVSPAGAYLDPLADKLMVATTLIMLIPLSVVPAWLVALLLCREMAITGLRGIASQEGMLISASTLGKFKTAYQGAAIGVLLVHDPFWGIQPQVAGLALLYIATFFSLASGTEYFVQFFRQGAGKPR